MNNIYNYLSKTLYKPNILVLGDFILDIYEIGQCERISLEAPIPIVKHYETIQKAGGAGNVANNLASLGCKTFLGGFFPSTFNIRPLIDSEIEVVTCCCETVVVPTKIRVVTSQQQIVRYDKEQQYAVNENYIVHYINTLKTVLSTIDCIVISDYLKGNLNIQFVRNIIKLANELNIPVLVDTKRTKDITEWYSGCYALKINKKEYDDICVEYPSDIKSTSNLIERLNLKACCITLSKEGVYFERDGNKVQEKPQQKIEVYDVIGAGDSCLAALAISIVEKFEDKEVVQFLNAVGQCKVQHKGNYSVTKYDIKNYFSLNNKIICIEEVERVLNRHKNKIIVLTNGCFDMLHVGHLDSLEYAKQQGDILIVALNSDISVKLNKGSNRPIINQLDRARMLSALQIVDYVILFDDKSPHEVIKRIKPNILIKGIEWKDKVSSEEFVKSYGGMIKYCDRNNVMSTTGLIKTIKEAL